MGNDTVTGTSTGPITVNNVCHTTGNEPALINTFPCHPPQVGQYLSIQQMDDVMIGFSIKKFDIIQIVPP